MRNSKKAISITLLAVMLISTFAVLGVSPVSATVPLDMRFNIENTFAHDQFMRLGTTYSGSNVLPMQLDCHLMRVVSWYTDTSSGSSGLMVIQTQSQMMVGGSFTVDNDFEDTLDLTGLNWNNGAAPDQWVGVHWAVGYYIQYKWSTIPGDILGQTGTHWVSCNELSQDTFQISGSGILTGSGGTSTINNICGFEDGNEGAIYGSTGNTQGYINGEIHRSDIGSAGDNYRLMMKVHDWNGQPIYMTAYIGQSINSFSYDGGSGWYYPTGTSITTMCYPTLVNWLGSTWLDFGEIPDSAWDSWGYTEWAIVVKTTPNLSGILWVDTVQAVGLQGQPY